MRKLIKIVGVFAGILVIVLIAAAIALAVFFDPNQFKNQITDYVKQTTGRELAIPGEVSLSFFPWLGIEVGEARLSNAAGFDQQPFASVNGVDVKVKLLPLLQRAIVADTIELQGLELHLTRNEKGETNWQDLTADEAQPGDTTAAPASAPPEWDVNIAGFELSDARITWDDRQADTRWTLLDVNFNAGRLALGQEVDLELAFNFLPAPDAEPVPVSLTAAVRANPAEEVLDVPEFRLKLANLAMQGQLRGTNIMTSPRFEGAIAAPEFVPRELMDALNITIPAARDPAVLGKAAIKSAFNATEKAVVLHQLELRVDDTTVRGELAVENLEDPAYRFDLIVDEIDVDRYLPPPTEAPPEQQPAPPQPGVAGVALPVEVLRDLNLNGSLRVGKLKIYELNTEDIQLNVKAAGGELRVHPATAKLYGGGYSGDVRINAAGKVPRIAVDEKLTGVQALPLFEDAADWTWLSGTAELTARLNASGATPDALRQSLDGQLAFAFTDGSINGINLAYRLRQARAVLRGEPPPAEEPQQTDFTELRGTANVNKGVLENRDLELKSPLLRATGSGTVNLVTERLDYLLRAAIVGELAGQSGTALDELKGVVVPVRVQGPFADPKINVDIQAALTEKQKQRLEEKTEELKEKARGKIEEKLRDLLKR